MSKLAGNGGMTTDMLRLAGDGEGVRKEGFAGGEAAEPHRPLRPPAPPAASAIDLRALVMHAVVPRLARTLRDRSTTLPPLPSVPARVPARASAPSPVPGREPIIGDLVDTLLRDDLSGLCRTVEAARACGRPLDRIYLDLLAPAAAAIARLVDADDCSPAAGTLAFCNLQILLRRYASDFYEEGTATPRGLRALLVPMRAATGAAAGLPVFGLLLAADFLRRAGWEAWVETSLGRISSDGSLRGQWFDCVQLIADEGAPAEEEIREAADGIRAIRRNGANPRVVVVACGPAFARDAELLDRLGADGGVCDPLSILGHPGRFVDHASHRQAQRRRLQS